MAAPQPRGTDQPIGLLDGPPAADPQPVTASRKVLPWSGSRRPDRVPWETIDLTTQVGILAWEPFLVSGSKGEVIIVEVQGEQNHHVVRAWSSEGGNRRLRGAGFTTISALSAQLGVVSSAAISATPSIRWRRWGAPDLIDAEGNPVALSDATARLPTAARFESALAIWAQEVRVTFEAARSHAETVGLAHLPVQARSAARRAAGAARLATESDNPAERLAAELQVNRILGSLALYYLPAGFRAAVTEGAQP